MTAHITEERIATVETEKKDATMAEVCLGAIMGITAILGLFGVVSFLVSVFSG